MNKVLVASFLAAAAIAPNAQAASTQTAVNLGAGQQPGATGEVQMSQAEATAYNNAMGQTAPAAKAQALEAYLTAYPQSAVKSSVLQQLMVAYSQIPDQAKALDAADRLLQVDPGNIRALTLEVYFRKNQADQLTDPAAKQAGLDKAADYAQKGLQATKPKDMSDADFQKIQQSANPIFYSAIGTAALNKKDTATAITNFKQELAAVPVESTTQPGPVLQDTYFLGLAYLQSSPPDYVNCTFYVTRFVAYAPEPYKSQMTPTATYCYKKYHGNSEGYDAVVTAAKANLNPPSGFTITPAPKASDIAHQTVTSTSDLSTLALSDKEFILQNGTAADADKVFATIKGKDVKIPDATVISATDSALQVAVSDDAVQSKTADFTFNMKEPLKTPPTVGSKVTLSGVYQSYTRGGVSMGGSSSGSSASGTSAAGSTTGSSDASSTGAASTTSAASGDPGPVMIVMSDGELASKAAPKAPVHHAPARRP